MCNKITVRKFKCKVNNMFYVFIYYNNLNPVRKKNTNTRVGG